MSPEELAERITRLEERQTAAALTSALTKEELDRRLHEMNAFRAQINQERGIYLTRDMYDREHGLLTDRVVELEKSKAGAMGTVGAYGSIVAIIIALIAAYLSRGH